MLVRLLHSLRLRLRGSKVNQLLHRTGVSNLGRRLYTRRLMTAGIHTIRLLGHNIRFAISAEREITRLDDLAGEEPMLARLIEALKPGAVLYDVGANIGVMSLAAAIHHRASNLIIHAIEPETANADRLERNVLLNKVTGVVVHRCALGAANGTASLFIDGEVGSGAHSLVKGHTGQGRELTIEVLTGAEFAGRIGAPPDVVKIDVEGAELDVLRGLAPLLERRPPSDIFVELHPETLARLGETPESAHAFLKKFGYEPCWSQGRDRQVHVHYRRSNPRPA